MTQLNPYESPSAELQAPNSKFSFALALLALVVFSVVSFQSFLIILLTFFGKSTAYWPGYLCGGIGVLIGILAAFLTLKTKVVQQVGWASLLAASLGSFLIIFALTMQIHPERISEHFLPATVSDMGIGHFLILAFSILGAFFGIWGFISGVKNHRAAGMLIGGGFGFPCVGHLVAMALRLAFH